MPVQYVWLEDHALGIMAATHVSSQHRMHARLLYPFALHNGMHVLAPAPKQVKVNLAAGCRRSSPPHKGHDINTRGRRCIEARVGGKTSGAMWMNIMALACPWSESCSSAVSLLLRKGTCFASRCASAAITSPSALRDLHDCIQMYQ